MSENDVPNVPGVPDLGGPIPQPYEEIIESIGSPEPDSRKAAQYDARLRIWLVFTELRFRQLMAKEEQEHAKELADTALIQAKTAAESADRTAKSLRTATWILVFVTVVLSVATIAAAFIARSPS
jgi:hypothetical protein